MIADLIKRLEAAAGPDRGLDSEIEVATGIAKYRDGKGRACYHDGRRDRVPHYTASIDAAMALKERVLPEWVANILQREAGWESTLHLHRKNRADKGPHVVVVSHPTDRTPYSPNGAIALCLAILRAKEQETR